MKKQVIKTKTGRIEITTRKKRKGEYIGSGSRIEPGIVWISALHKRNKSSSAKKAVLNFLSPQ